MRRVGMLLPATADDSEYPMLVKTFVEGLQQLGWTEGRNVRIDIRWAGGSADTNRKNAEELVALAPDVIMASGNASAPQDSQVLPTTLAGNGWDYSRRSRLA
jgi:putative ABC transport system substrate-binding protein